MNGDNARGTVPFSADGTSKLLIGTSKLDEPHRRPNLGSSTRSVGDRAVPPRPTGSNTPLILLNEQDQALSLWELEVISGRVTHRGGQRQLSLALQLQRPCQTQNILEASYAFLPPPDATYIASRELFTKHVRVHPLHGHTAECNEFSSERRDRNNT